MTPDEHTPPSDGARAFQQGFGEEPITCPVHEAGACPEGCPDASDSPNSHFDFLEANNLCFRCERPSDTDTGLCSHCESRMERAREQGNVLSEDWLLDHLPEGWTYDCQMHPENAFVIEATDGKSLTIPLRLLRAPEAPKLPEEPFRGTLVHTRSDEAWRFEPQTGGSVRATHLVMGCVESEEFLANEAATAMYFKLLASTDENGAIWND